MIIRTMALCLMVYSIITLRIRTVSTLTSSLKTQNNNIQYNNSNNSDVHHNAAAKPLGFAIYSTSLSDVFLNVVAPKQQRRKEMRKTLNNTESEMKRELTWSF
jgi:hypothetical protein